MCPPYNHQRSPTTLVRGPFLHTPVCPPTPHSVRSTLLSALTTHPECTPQSPHYSPKVSPPTHTMGPSCAPQKPPPLTYLRWPSPHTTQVLSTLPSEPSLCIPDSPPCTPLRALHTQLRVPFLQTSRNPPHTPKGHSYTSESPHYTFSRTLPKNL